MASASNYQIKYIKTKRVKASRITSASILSEVPIAKVIQLRQETAKIGINNGEAVTFKYGDIGVIESGDTWLFLQDTDIAIGTIVNLLP